MDCGGGGDYVCEGTLRAHFTEEGEEEEVHLAGHIITTKLTNAVPILVNTFIHSITKSRHYLYLPSILFQCIGKTAAILYTEQEHL